jgi:hypothetical protein
VFAVAGADLGLIFKPGGCESESLSGLPAGLPYWPLSTLLSRSAGSKAAIQDSGSGHTAHWDKLPLREA